MSDFQFAPLFGKSLLITGASGLIGSAVIDLLMDLNRTQNAQISISALCRNQTRAEGRFADFLTSPLFQILVQDVCEPLPSDAHWDGIIHAASPAHPLAYSQTPVEVMKANLLGTINVLEYAKNHKCRVVYVSSGEIYGQSTDPNAVFSESDTGLLDPLSPRSCYPESKRAAETLCVTYFSEYGTESVIARPCYIYGPGINQESTRVDAQFLNRVLAGQNIIMKSQGTQTRSYCHARDAATALLTIFQKGVPGEAYNVADSRSVSTIRNYAEILAGLAKVGIEFDLPSEAERLGYSPVQRAVLSPAKLESLGWKPEFDLKEGLAQTLKVLLKR